MPNARKAVSMLVSGIQCSLGGLACILAYLIYASQSIQETLSIAPEEVSLSMFLLLVFGMLSILSGLLLVQEGNGGY
jgi:uncharacterized protein with PQ loop repeat